MSGGGASGEASGGGGGGAFEADAPVGAVRAAPKRASQSEFAASVARDVATDMIPAPVRWGLGIAALIAVLYFIYAVLM